MVEEDFSSCYEKVGGITEMQRTSVQKEFVTISQLVTRDVSVRSHIHGHGEMSRDDA